MFVHCIKDGKIKEVFFILYASYNSYQDTRREETCECLLQRKRSFVVYGFWNLFGRRSSMMWRNAVFGALVKVDPPYIIVTHCFLLRCTLVTETLLPKLPELLKIVVECLNYCRNSSLKRRVFKELCNRLWFWRYFCIILTFVGYPRERYWIVFSPWLRN